MQYPDSERCRSSLLQVAFFFLRVKLKKKKLDHFRMHQLDPPHPASSGPIRMSQNTSNNGCLRTQLLASPFQQLNLFPSQPLRVRVSPLTPNEHPLRGGLLWLFPGELPAPGARCIRHAWASSSPVSSRGSNLRAICRYLGNVLRTLHGHICTRAVTSPLFLVSARCWRLL